MSKDLENNISMARINLNTVVDRLNSIENKYERGGAAVSINEEIIKNQSLQVDAVSGATNSSKAILKSIENTKSSERY